MRINEELMRSWMGSWMRSWMRSGAFFFFDEELMRDEELDEELDEE